MKSICSPPTALCLLPAAFEEPQVRRAGPALPLLFAFCLLPTACLYLGQAGWRRLLAGMAALDKMSPLTGKEKTSNFKK